MNIRCRGPAGAATLSGLDPATTVLDFQQQVAEKCGVAVERQELLGGFPPRPIQIPGEPSSAPLSSLGLHNGDSITVRELPAPEDDHSALGAVPQPEVTPEAAGSLGPTGMSEDEQLAQAIAMSMSTGMSSGNGSGVAATQSPQVATGDMHVSNADPSSNPSAPSYVALPSGAVVARRIIDSDNSCLFNAVGYVMQRTRSKSLDLRKVIADVVAADPISYNDGVLGKDANEYCRWIREPNTWGGAIELSILCNHYSKEIAAYDIQTKRCDVYGEGSGFTERVMVIYDGLHYDALAMGAFEGAPEEIDITIFSHSSPELLEAEEGASQLVKACHEARQFTDTGNFTLRCGTCQIGVKGEKEAREHARTTGHTNFSEYH